MGKFRGIIGKAMTLALAASMIFQGTAMAAPLDELNEMLSKQEENASKSLLGEALGLSELGAAIAENGLNAQLKAGLTQGTAELLDIEEIPEDGYVSLGLQVDPVQKAWALGAGAGDAEKSILDLLLYGDADQLAVTVPQFFSGAVALSAGNLKEQYENSALAEMLGGAENVPDIDLSFYPEADGSDQNGGLFAGMQEQIETEVEALGENVQVEKTQDGDADIYKLTIPSEDIMEIYSIILKEYISVFDELGLLASVSPSDMTAIDQEIEDMIGQMGSVLGDVLTVDFVARNGLVQEMHYELYCDTTVLNSVEEIMTEAVEEALAPAGNAEDAGGAQDAAADGESAPDMEEDAAEAAGYVTLDVDGSDGPTAVFGGEVIGGADGPVDITIEAEDFTGYISYDIVYFDPEDVSSGFYMDMRVKDLEETELAALYMDLKRTEDGTAEKYSCTIDMTEEGETIYSATPFTAVFDSATGDFDVTLVMEDEDGNGVTAKLDSTFTQIEKGKSFVWSIDALALESGGESIGVTGEVQISADPGELPAPQDVRELLKLTDTEISTLMQEIQLNALIWGAQFAPEIETETEAAF